jgi:dihydrofolate reductase
MYTRPHDGSAEKVGGERIAMNPITVIQFITVDGVVEDPDGANGTPYGGWAFRFGPEAVAGDKFKLGVRLECDALLLGRGTWQKFTQIWPAQSDEFSTRMNKAQKWVASRTLTDVGAWSNSQLLKGELIDAVQRLRGERGVIVVGSTSVVHTLMEHDLVDEYHLLVFPAVAGAGLRLFDGPAGAGDLRLVSVEQSGAAALLRYERARAER